MKIIKLFSVLAWLTYASAQDSAELVILNTTLPIPTTYTAAAFDGEDSIYIMGGMLTESLKTDVIYKFSISSETIEEVGRLPENLYTGDALWDERDKRIYLASGATQMTYKINPNGPNGTFEFETILPGPVLMFTTMAWDGVRRRGYIFGHRLAHSQPGFDFFEYDEGTGIVQAEDGIWTHSMSGLASVCDQSTGHVYYFGGRIWVGSIKLETIYRYRPENKTLELLPARLPYAYEDGKEVWDEETGTAYIFDTGNYDHAGLVKYETRTGILTYIPIPILQELVITRFGLAYVKKLNRIYMFGGNDEKWWEPASNRIQYVQLS